MRRNFSKTALWLLAVSVATALLFQGLRARRLLQHARQIALRSAAFPRDYWLGQGPKITYLAMGDSTAAGWGAGGLNATYPHRIASALAARGFRVRVVNVAVGGATLAQVRRGQSPVLKSLRPDIVTLSAGANDATHRTANADFAREMRAMRADLTASGAQTVLVANVPDLFFAPALPYPLAMAAGKRSRALNAIMALTTEKSGFGSVDLYRQGQLDYRRDARLYAADLFHPSGRGYAVWAGLFLQKMKWPAPPDRAVESRAKPR